MSTFTVVVTPASAVAVVLVPDDGATVADATSELLHETVGLAIVLPYWSDTAALKPCVPPGATVAVPGVTLTVDGTSGVPVAVNVSLTKALAAATKVLEPAAVARVQLPTV